MKKIIFTIAFFLVLITNIAAQNQTSREYREKIDKQFLEDSKNPKLILIVKRLDFLNKTSALSYANDRLKKITTEYVGELKKDPNSWDAIKMRYGKLYAKIIYDIEVNYKNWVMDLFLDDNVNSSQKEKESDRESIMQEIDFVAKNKILMQEIFK